MGMSETRTDPNNTNAASHQEEAGAVLSISGADARKFLQGQISCDVEILHGEALIHLTGAHCNLKGRIVSSFEIVRDFRLDKQSEDQSALPDGIEHVLENNSQVAGESYLLRVDKDNLDVAKKQLDQYARFSKVTISKRLMHCSYHRLHSKDGVMLALKHRQAIYTQDSVTLVYQTDRGWLLETLQNQLEDHGACSTPAFIEALGKTYTVEPIDYSFFLQSLAMQSLIYCNSAMSENWLPHDLAYEKISAVSFKKGCFLGQEVIARMHYKAKSQKSLGIAVISRGALSEADSSSDHTEASSLEVSEGQIIRAIVRGKSILLVLSFRKAVPDSIGINHNGEVVEAPIFPPVPLA